jgi:hypothetical protein
MSDRAISKLSLYFTAPSYWIDGQARNLREFLTFLIEPSRPGVAALGISASSDDAGEGGFAWLQAAEALAHVASCYENTWLPAETDPDPHEDALLNDLVSTKATIFMDQARFEACREQLPLDRRATSAARSPPMAYWIGLTIDWARSEGATAWFPQFRIYSYWPESADFAPPAADHSSSVADLGYDRRFAPAVAAEVLDAVYWQAIETDFRNLRYYFGLGTAITGDFEPPVFFVAQPASAPPMPEGYLEDHWWEALATMSDRDLRVRDPFASEVVCAVVDGRFMVFSNGYQSVRSRQRQDYYLVLPAAASATARHGIDEERLSVIADQLAFIHFSAARTASNILNEASVIRQKLRVQAAIRDRTSETAQRILDAASAEGRRELSKTDGDLRRLARELQLVVERMRLQFRHSELEIDDLDARLEAGKSVDAESLSRWLAVRRTHRGRSLSGAEIAPTVVAMADLQRLRRDGARDVRNLEQLKATFDGVLAHVAQGEREREDRAEKRLSYLLVFLAAIVAFPLLTGHMDWSELATALNRRSTLGRLVWETHAVAAWISVVAALAGIAALACYLILRSSKVRRVAIQRRERSRAPDRSPGEIASIWFKLAGGAYSNENGGATRANDKAVLQALAAETSWLLHNAIEDDDAESIKSLRARVAIVSALSELFMLRPNPLMLPSTLIFMRHCGPRFFGPWVGSEVVSERELFIALLGEGTAMSAREQLDTLRADERLLSAQTIDDLAAAADRVLLEDRKTADAPVA